jgi:class 3 adenylate cyclase
MAGMAAPNEPGTKPQVTRKLTAILSVDISGYSRLKGADQEDTFMRLTFCREIIFGAVREHDGKAANTAGDTVLANSQASTTR